MTIFYIICSTWLNNKEKLTNKKKSIADANKDIFCLKRNDLNYNSRNFFKKIFEKTFLLKNMNESSTVSISANLRQFEKILEGYNSSKKITLN